MRGNLYMRVEVYAGADCREAIHEMASLASHIRVTVSAKMNGVTVSAPPFCDSKALGDAWDAEMQTPDRPYKHVCGRPFPLGRAVEQQPTPEDSAS
jgi:hypothetical protein